jgi:DNA-binding GntR family transcriptional regulator
MADSSNAHGPGPSAPIGHGVRNLTLREQVLEYLREEILSNRLEPGAELNEAALSQSLGVSRGPVREAIGRLASEGLVRAIPRRGAIVTALTREEFVDAYQVREALETLAIRLAVPRFEPDDLAELRELHEEMVRHAEHGEVKAFFDTNAAFHRLFVDGSGNRKLQEVYRLLMDQMGRYLARSLALRGTLAKSVAEHSAILEAVEVGDAERAVRLLADHIEVPQRVEEATGEHPVATNDQPTTNQGGVR